MAVEPIEALVVAVVVAAAHEIEVSTDLRVRHVPHPRHIRILEAKARRNAQLAANSQPWRLSSWHPLTV